VETELEHNNMHIEPIINFYYTHISQKNYFESIELSQWIAGLPHKQFLVSVRRWRKLGWKFYTLNGGM